MKNILLILMFFIFQGCNTKQVTSPSQTEHIEISIQTKEDNTDASEFDDEFDDETIEVADPLNRYNRMMTSVNDAIIIHALNPVSKAYAYVIPRPFRVGLENAIHNIQFPIRFVNNLLQGKFQNVSDETERFIVNSTVGLAGFMDPAKNYMNIPAHNEDFGQTLGYYGVEPGFHIVLPFFGPSNVRDLAGLTIDGYLSPLVNVRGLENYKISKNFTQTTAIIAGYFINKNALNMGAYESLKKDALDLYPFLRDIYEQKRLSDIEE
ncbi:MAG: ABC transporter [Sulfurovum sp.]|nr:MAG: ABC transporter [Sulfurovum sp.]